MERFAIIGGVPLQGTVHVNGAKNATLPIMAATVLAAGRCTICDAPYLRDVTVMTRILESLGAEVRREGRNLSIDTGQIDNWEIPENLMRETRSSIFLMGALLARKGKVRVAYPGGCNIGPRPIDLHLKGLRALNAQITERHGYVYAETKGLRGAEVHLDFPSVGATENIMMAAVRARGTTIIRNAAKEPEIVDLQNFLNKMGARIRGAGTDTIKIDGVESLGPISYTVIPDRIETGTFMVAAAMTGGEILIENGIFEHVEPIAAKLREAGAEVEGGETGIRVRGTGRLVGVDIKTLPYPGYPTDMQPQTMAMLSIAKGTSVIIENIFANRFKHVDELLRMGAQIKTEGRAAIIRGVEGLTGSAVEASDLRAGVALILAGLVAEGKTTIDNIYHVDRGYEAIEKKLQKLGAQIWRLEEPA
ncbi:MAG TPA: UDP-N-acetylglucosamine 1-carboxyvinyltransferase [Firmicutes bacterium]|nr:UDP-N-acetylglucosamine 1-carboxyvinyltransferase [Bacillota bacterium]